MVPRKPLDKNWRSLTDEQLAWRLEADVMDKEKLEKLHGVPGEVIKYMLQTDVPIAIGRNGWVGWFVLCCGQGPALVWMEAEK